MSKIWRSVVLTVLMLSLFTGCAGKKTTTASGAAPGLPTDEITYQGETYRIRKGLTTILVMGLDKYDRQEGMMGFTNNLQSDFLILLVIDEEAKTCEALHLNRDTMTEIRSLGIGGGTAGTFIGQLALAHTYGSGGSDSCLNAVRAVSDLLCGVEIDHYMTLTMDAVATINDMVGGVTVTVLDDMTQVDPAMEKGKELTLMGDQALLYVRSRKGLEDSSNLNRMERQRQYMKGLYTNVMDQNRKDDTFLADALLAVSDSFASDCAVTQLESLAELMDSCEMLPIRSLEGKAKKGEEFMEFHVNEDSLMKNVIALFCEKKA